MHIPHDRGSEQIVYNGAAELMPLRGPSAQILTLEQPGVVKFVQWLPTDRRAQDVEIRAYIQAATPNAVNPVDPSVFWRREYGHGVAVLQDPVLTPYPLNAHPGGWNLNARGLVTRVTAREMKFSLYYNGSFGTGNPPTNVVCSVSFQPVLAMPLPPPPYQDVFVPGLAAKAMQFPAGANEWKLFDEFGVAYPAAFGVDVLLFDVMGKFMPFPGPLTPLDRHRFADWTPIPQRAAGWEQLLSAAPDSNPIYVAYR